MTAAYNTKIETHSISGTFYQIYSLKNRDQFDDPNGVAERSGISSAMWPIFGMVWPAGLVLAEIMSTYNISQLKILELGCGLGFASLIINARGGNITASDHHPLTETFMTENSRINSFPSIRYQACDWSNPITTLGKFDLIIGSDLLYEPHHPELLARFINLHANKATQIIIVNPKRRQQANFKRRMTTLGYSTAFENSSEKQFIDHGFKGKIFTFSRV
ncbi:MAG: methyltransferase protein [Verrucomicrobiaceae bacterium]|nr:methyltransferase protein [Verrucomicrobiaceae bacterium]